MGNIAGFAAPYITGAVKDWTGGYGVPMTIVGGFMLLSAILSFAVLSRLDEPRNQSGSALRSHPAHKTVG